MSVTISRLDQKGLGGGNTSLTSNSVTPGAYTTVMAMFFSEEIGTAATDPTITGGGLTWTKQSNDAFNLSGVASGRLITATAFTGSTSGAFTVKADYGSSIAFLFMILDKGDEVDRVSPFVQTKFSGLQTASALTSGSFTSPMQQGNGVWGAILFGSDSATLTAGSGYTLLAPATTISTFGRAQTEWRGSIDSNQTVTATASTSLSYFMTGVEVRADNRRIVGGTSVRHYDDSSVTYYEPLDIRRYTQSDVRRYDQ